MNETPVMKPSGNVIWKNLISTYPGAVLYGLLRQAKEKTACYCYMRNSIRVSYY